MERLIFAIIAYGAIALIGSLLKLGDNGRAGGTAKKIDLLGSSGDYDPAPAKGDVDPIVDDPPDIAAAIDGWADKLGELFTDKEEEKEEPFSWRAKDEDEEEVPAWTPAAPEQQVDHDHIPSTALNREKRLEQLERLREAGLLDEDEYKQKKREIKRGE